MNEFVPVCLLNESVVHAQESECAGYYADQVNEMMACIQINIAVCASIDAHVVQVNESAATLAVLECGDYFNSVQLNDHTIQRVHNNHNSLSIFKNSFVSPSEYIQLHSTMLQIILILCFIQSNLNSQVSVILSRAMHIIFCNTV